MSTPHTPAIYSEYLHQLLESSNAQHCITACVSRIKEGGAEFDAIAFTGVSGALCAPIVAFLLDKPLIVVRKPDDKSTHSTLRVEGDRSASTYIIVDDFVATGRTIGTIVAAIRAWNPESTCVGVATTKPSQLKHFTYAISSVVAGCVPNLSCRVGK